MLDLSEEFKNEIYDDNRNFLPFLDITLKEGTVLNLTKSDVWENSFKVEDATSASNTFTIGAAVTGKLSVTLNNIYDKFSDYDFADATVVAYVGMQLSNTIEKIRVGTYIVDEPSYDGSTISISCLDYLSKFDKPYSKSTLKYPAALLQILQDACAVCGITLLSVDFQNKDYVVQTRPADDALTFGDIVAMVAQIAGCWAKMDVYGRLKLGWYNMALFEEYERIDGGSFGNILESVAVDGGTFTDIPESVAVDGGSFEDMKLYHHIYLTKSFAVSTDDVVITGIRVTEEFEETDTEKMGSYLAGKEGYVIEVSGNALIQQGKAKAVADYLYGRIGGMRFRPLEVECLTDPSMEAGDIAYVTDRKQNTYQSFISNRVFTIGGTERITCDAETPARNSAKRYSEMTRAVVKARKETERRISSYDLAVQQLTNLMTQSFGVFKSEEVLEDGSIIYYMHNKPERANSSTIWKMTADAFAVSTDGGKTWNAGIDSSGNAVVNVLNAIGINADWINAGDVLIGGTKQNKDGSIIVYDKDDKEIFKVSKDGFFVNTENFKIDENADVFMRNPYIDTAMYMNMLDNVLSEKSKYRKVIGQTMIQGSFYPRLEDVWYAYQLVASQYGIDVGDGYGHLFNSAGISIRPIPQSGAETAKGYFIGNDGFEIKMGGERVATIKPQINGNPELCIDAASVLRLLATRGIVIETTGTVSIPTGEVVAHKVGASNIVHGIVTITPSAANTPTAKAVTWSSMPDTPNVICTPATTVPGTKVLGIGVRDMSKTGCTIYLTRSDTTVTSVNYIAIS